MKTRALTFPKDEAWLQMRQALWPDATTQEHLEEMAGFLAAPEKFAQFLATSDDGKPIGFAEASIRAEYVNGTDTSPVAFLEGIYVKPSARRQGVARALIGVVEQWAKSKRCSELASDAPVQNRASRAVHGSLGFTETERVVYFKKNI